MSGYEMHGGAASSRARSRSASMSGFNSSSVRMESGVRHYHDKPDPELLAPSPRFAQVMERMDKKNAESRSKQEAKMRLLEEQQKTLMNVTLSSESKRILETSDKDANFYDRLNISLYQRARASEIAAIKHKTYENETFKPEINPYSTQMPRRSPQDLSHGDMIRKKQIIQLKRIQKVRSELDGVTFQPQRIKKPQYEQNESILSARNIEHDYLTLVQAKEDEKRSRMEKAKKEREEAALAKCTFKPSTSRMPAFIREQIAAQKARRALEPKKVDKSDKPGWV